MSTAEWVWDGMYWAGVGMLAAIPVVGICFLLAYFFPVHHPTLPPPPRRRL
jgi:hypothetical protein